MKGILEAGIVFALVYLIFETRKKSGAGCGCGCGSSGGCVSSGLIASVPASNAVTQAGVAAVNPNVTPVMPAPVSTARLAVPLYQPRLNVLSGPEKLAQLSTFQSRPVYVQ